MIPDRIGSVRVGRLLSSGDGFTVYAGVDPAREQPVAVRVAIAPDDAAATRFLDAARTLRLLASDRVVRVFDAGRLADGTVYAITELTRQSLADRIAAREGGFAPSEALALAATAAACLLDAHGHGVIFRDPGPASFRFAGDRMVVDDWSVVPMSERITASPQAERDAIRARAAALFSLMTREEEPAVADPFAPATDDRAGLERSIIGLTIPAAPEPVSEPVSEPGPAPAPAVAAAGEETVVLRTETFDQSPAPRRRVAAGALAIVLIAGIAVGTAIGWAATRSSPVGAPVSAPAPTTTKAGAATTGTKAPGATPKAASPSTPGSTPAATATSAGTVAPAPSASVSRDDPQGRAGRYTGFITATNGGCGSLQEGRNDAVTVDVAMQNGGKSAIFTFKLGYRDEPIAVTVTVAENGAFRGDYNVDGTAGKMSGTFAGERIADVSGSEDDCSYAWSAKRSA